jgi:hypothetical protein
MYPVHFKYTYQFSNIYLSLQIYQLVFKIYHEYCFFSLLQIPPPKLISFLLVVAGSGGAIVLLSHHYHLAKLNYHWTWLLPNQICIFFKWVNNWKKLRVHFSAKIANRFALRILDYYNCIERIRVHMLKEEGNFWKKLQLKWKKQTTDFSTITNNL